MSVGRGENGDRYERGWVIFEPKENKPGHVIDCESERNLRRDAFAERPPLHRRLVFHVLDLFLEGVLVHAEDGRSLSFLRLDDGCE